MPRKQRICLADVSYHTASRCIEKKALMKNAMMKDLMISVIKLTQKKYNFQLNNFSLMNNHFHFIIKTEKNGASISRIMQFIKSQYAQRYNRLMNRTGPFWNERFSDTIIKSHENNKQLYFHVFFYVEYNPVKSCYVADPRDYSYNSIRCYLDENYIPPVKITLNEFFLNLGNTFQERANKLLDMEELYRKRIFQADLFE